MPESRFAKVVERVGQVLLAGAVLQAAALLATAPLWAMLAVSPLVTSAYWSPGWGAGTLLAGGGFVVPALVAASRTVSRLRDGEVSVWKPYWAFLRRHYLSALRIGVVHALIWAVIWVALWWLGLGALPLVAVWVVLAGHSIGFEAHLELNARQNMVRSVLLAGRTPGTSALALLTWVFQGIIVTLSPGVLLLGLAGLAVSVNYLFHHALRRVA